MSLLDSDPRADEDVQTRLARICTKLDDVRAFLVQTDIFTPHPFNARVSRSPLGGFGLFANAGGLHAGDVLEFTEGHMGYTWSDEAFYNDVGGFVIHLKSGRCFIVRHHMDYKQLGYQGADTVNACFSNAVARRGQVVDQHPRYLLNPSVAVQRKPKSCTRNNQRSSDRYGTPTINLVSSSRSWRMLKSI